MQMTTVLGLLIGLGGILVGNLLEGGTFGTLFQLTAFFIVFGGTVGAVVVSHRAEDLKLAWSYLKYAFETHDTGERSKVAAEIIQTAQLVRRESILALEPGLTNLRDPFMRAIYRFIIDGTEPEVLKKVFSDEIAINERRKMAAAKVWADAGGFAPTIGIIGAVLGLIGVMASINDTNMLAKGIAVAFVATIYGVGSANLIFLPIANKLRTLIRFRSETEYMIVEGAVAIAGGLNPYLIEQKMRAFTTEIKGI